MEQKSAEELYNLLETYIPEGQDKPLALMLCVIGLQVVQDIHRSADALEDIARAQRIKTGL